MASHPEARITAQKLFEWGHKKRATVRVRTGDLLITNQLLYQLSYGGLYLLPIIGYRSPNLFKYE